MRKRILPAAVFAALLLAVGAGLRAQDAIEFLSGAKVEGKVTAIDKAAQQVTFETTIAGRALSRTYPYSRIHAVTYNGKRYVLNEKTSAPAGGTAAGSAGSSRASGRSRAEVQAMIDAAGKTLPDWFDATPLNYAKTLDLSYPPKPPAPWNNQKNVGQYNWDVINPNPAKWREGVKFMHFLLTENKDRPETAQRVMNDLGRMYHNLLEDYARAAFWWQQGGVHDGTSPYMRNGAHLASCYYKLGNKQMAVELLTKYQSRYGDLQFILVWAEMGELEAALKLADAYAKAAPAQADGAYILAGDVCRTAGRYPQAVEYYKKVLAVQDDEKRAERGKKRAEEALDAIKQFELSDVRKVPDGAYRSSSQGYEAQVEVEVVVNDHRIESVRVTKHREKQFYSAMSDTPAKIIAKQGVKGVDATASATITSEAIINATAKALAEAQK